MPTTKFLPIEFGGVLLLYTSKLTLRYIVGMPFNETGSIVIYGKGFAWRSGMYSSQDPGNLYGTFRTLDGTANVPLNCTLN